MIIWVKRKDVKPIKLNMSGFLKKFKRLTKGWDNDSLSLLLNLLIKITRAKKEENKIKEKE